MADARTFRDQAHALRSSAAHVGALGLFDLCLSWRELDDHALMMRVGGGARAGCAPRIATARRGAVGLQGANGGCARCAPARRG